MNTMNTAITVLMILTSQATMGTGGTPTGVWFEELSTPYYAFVDAGAKVEIVSINGGQIPIDPHSLKAPGKNPPSVERFLNDKEAMSKITQSKKLGAEQVVHYDAVFLPGGHGTMWDFPNSQALANLISTAWKDGKVIAAVCHGPAGLVNARDENGQALVAGRRISAFTDAEEVAAGLDQTVPFLLETRLRNLGANFESGPNFQPFFVRDGRLITGQNPASSDAVAKATLEAAHENFAAALNK
jgi:putative intracellular protease/amidase